jgi:hypothetical protein
MKTFPILFLLLLVVSVVFPQDKIIPKHQHSINLSSLSKAVSVDNDCLSPTNLEAHVDTVGSDQYMVYLTWDMEVPDEAWIHWDNGENFSGTVAGSDDLFAAARWDSGQLIVYHGFKITKIRAFLYESGYSNLVFHIWTGQNAENSIYAVEHDTLLGGQWIEHSLDTALYVDSSLEYWVGYSIYVDTVGRFYLGVDEGEAVAGYGDKISIDGTTWDNLTDFGLDYNFNIQFYAEDTTGSQNQVFRGSSDRNMNFMGYNLYHSLNGDGYELLDFIPSENDSNYHALPLEASPDLHCYKLTAVWTSPMDTCESAAAKVLGNPSADSVCVLMVGGDEGLSDKQYGLRCYPNPFSTAATIEYCLRYSQTVSLTFYDQFGKQVERIEKSCESGLNQVIWRPENLNSGVYFYALQVGETKTTGKLLLMK